MTFFALSVVLMVGFIFTQNTHKEDATTFRLISTAELKNNIERAVSFGKTYSENTNFYRLVQKIIVPIEDEINLNSIAFIGADQNSGVFYSYSAPNATKINFNTKLPKFFYQTGDVYNLIDYQGLKWIKVSLYNKDNNQYIGAFILGFSSDIFNLSLLQFIAFHLKAFVSLLFLTSLLFFLITSKWQDNPNANNTKFNTLYIFAIIIVCQFILGGIIMRNANEYFITSTKNVVQNIVHVQEQSMIHVFDLGLPLKTYEKSNEFLKSKLGISKDIYSFSILDKDENKIVSVILGEKAYDEPPIRLELKSKNQLVGYIEAQIDQEATQQSLYGSIFYWIIGLIISLLANMIILFLFARAQEKIAK